MLKIWAQLPASRDAEHRRRRSARCRASFSGTDFWHVNLLAEPWSDQRLSPFFGIGVGKFSNFPNQSLVGA